MEAGPGCGLGEVGRVRVRRCVGVYMCTCVVRTHSRLIGSQCAAARMIGLHQQQTREKKVLETRLANSHQYGKDGAYRV